MTTTRPHNDALDNAANDVLARMQCPDCPQTDDPCPKCVRLIGDLMQAVRADERWVQRAP